MLRYLKFILFLFLFLCCLESNAFAEQKSQVELIRYVYSEVTSKIEDTMPVEFYFSPDRDICKEKYGDQAFEICGRVVKDRLPSVKQIEMTPKHEGTWRWNDMYSLVFYPSKPWPADTQFTVKFGKESLPKYTVITKPVQFKTQAFKIKVFDGNFKFDPENINTKVISGKISFNYPVKIETVLSRISANTKEGAGITIGKLTGNFDNRAKNYMYSIPIEKVSDKQELVNIQLFSGVQAAYGGKITSNYSYSAKIPSRSEIFQFVGSQSDVQDMADMSKKQTIIFEFTLPVVPKDVAQNLSAFLLPRNKVLSDNDMKKEPYNWWSMVEITNDVKKIAKPVKLDLVNTPTEKSRFIIFTPAQDIEANRSLFVTIKAPLSGPENYQIKNDVQVVSKVKNLGTSIKIMQQGSLLTLSGDKKISLYARNADKIIYEVKQIRPELLNIFVPSLFGYNGNVDSSFDFSMASVISKGELPLQYENPSKAQFSSLDLGKFLQDKHKGIFYLNVMAEKKDGELVADTRFIMLTDIGMILKRNNNDENSFVYLVSLHDNKPLKNVKVEAIGQNGIPVFTGQSNDNGMIALPDLSHYINEKQVVALVASHGDDLAFIPYGYYNTEIRPQNKVNTQGKMLFNSGLYGFAFTQRDIYRPGEKVYLGFMVKQGAFDNALVNKMPLNAVIRSSRGQILTKKTVQLTTGGLGELAYQLDSNAESGMYEFFLEQADEGHIILNKTFHVSDFKPDTIKATVENNLGIKKLWYTKEEIAELVYTITANNLFGAPAINNTVKAVMSANPVRFSFKGYDNWHFFDAAKLEKTNRLDLGVYETDENGKVKIKIDNQFWGSQSAMLRLNAEVYDASGSSNIQVTSSLLVSPLKAVLGYTSKNNLQFLTKDEDAKISLVALDAMEKKVALGKINLELYQIDHVKTLIKDSNGQYRYTQMPKEKLLSKEDFTLNNSIQELAINTNEVGEKVLVIKDNDDRVLHRIAYNVVGDSQVQFDTYNKVNLQAYLDKKEYKEGDTIKVAMQLPYDGAGLITIEREKVYTQKWFTADKGNNVEEIEIPQGLEGKAYINILYFRNIEDEDIFTEPCASVVLPFTADISKRKLAVDVKIGDGSDNFIAKPGKEFSITVSSKQKAKAIVYAVDEGILQLTDYHAPNPLYELLLDRALEIRTFQYLELLMPEYNLVQKHLAKFGGGFKLANAMANAMDSASNPFKVKDHKPAVFWSGIVDINENGTIINIPVPDTFNGNLRVFVLASSESAVNMVEKDVLCQSDVIIQSFMPQFVAPNNIFEVSVFLTDMRKDKSNPKVKLVAEFPESFELITEKIQEITLDPKKQNIAYFRVKVKDNNDVLGEQNIRFVVIDDSLEEHIIMPAKISVRPASSRYTTVQIGQLEKVGNEYQANITLSRNLYPQFAEISTSISALPLPYVHSLLAEMETAFYPCSDELVAKAMVKALVFDNKEFAPIGEAFTSENMKKALMETIEMLSHRATHNTSSYYRYNGYGQLSLYEQVFIADFLTVARESGIGVPDYLFNTTLRNLEDNLSRLPNSIDEARVFAYGAYILTRNGIITSSIMANLSTYLMDNYQGWEKDIVASLMAGSMKLMMQDELAEKLINAYQPSKVDAWRYSFEYNGLSERALYLTVLANTFPEKLNQQKAQSLLKDMNVLLTKSHSLITEALTARAMILYSKSAINEKAQYHITFVDTANNALQKGIEITKNNSLLSEMIKDENTLANLSSTVKFTANTPAYYQITTTGYDKERKEVANQSINITREFRDIDGYEIKDFHLGDEVVVVIKAQSLVGNIDNIIITDILPAGFEFVPVKQNAVPYIRTTQGKSNQDVLQEEWDMDVDFANIQEDRLILFARLSDQESVFRYKVRVANKGEFTLPDITAEQVTDTLVYGSDNDAKKKKIIIK